MRAAAEEGPTRAPLPGVATSPQCALPSAPAGPRPSELGQQEGSRDRGRRAVGIPEPQRVLSHFLDVSFISFLHKLPHEGPPPVPPLQPPVVGLRGHRQTQGAQLPRTQAQERPALSLPVSTGRDPGLGGLPQDTQGGDPDESHGVPAAAARQRAAEGSGEEAAEGQAAALAAEAGATEAILSDTGGCSQTHAHGTERDYMKEKRH